MQALPKFTQADIDALSHELARRDFAHYRTLIHPKMKRGWFQDDAAAHLQQFYEDYIAGKRPILIISAPPQHGKSELIVDFVSWLAGKRPDDRAIYSSFSERLGIRANLKLQRIYDSAVYRAVFPDTRINSSNVVSISGQYLRNREILEYIGHEGYFRNTTVGGAITGEGLELGIIDDPIKGRSEAKSETVREKVWDWFLDDFFTRFADGAGMLMILTRWHIDDPAGRLIEIDPSVKVVNYEAIAANDEQYRKAGDALFPEHKSLDFLLKRKALMRASHWQSLYMGNPIIEDGEIFVITAIRIVENTPKLKRVIRYWDKAGTEGDGAYTAGAKLGETVSGDFIILDMVRGQWKSGTREKTIRQTAELDGTDVAIWIEQEPGSGGKESAEATQKNLVGFSCRVDRVTGDKELRADPLATQVEIGKVIMLRAPWNKALLDEMQSFPNGKYKDQVDACSGAFNKLTVRGAMLL